MILDILIIFFMLLTLWKMKPVTPLNEINDEFLSLKTCNSYKGFFAVIIIFHHLSQRISPGAILNDFTGIGFLGVAVFFFFSGYGLQKKNLSDSTYSHNFLIKRIPTILIPYIIMTFIYWLAYALLGDVKTISSIWTEFYKLGNPLVWFSWYVISILVFYVVFFVLMKIFRNNKSGMVLGSIVYYILYIIACRVLSFGAWWYMTVIAIIIGIIWANYEKKLSHLLKKASCIIVVLIWIVFAVLRANEWHIRRLLPQTWSEVIFSMIMSSLFVFGIIFTSARFKFGNKILNFLGNISFELYLVQGLFMLILRNDLLYIENGTVWSLAVISLSVVSAFFLNKLFKFILSKTKVTVA